MPNRKRIVTVDLADETVEFDLEDVSVHHKEYGVSIIPRLGREVGYRALFFPWGEIRRIKEHYAD